MLLGGDHPGMLVGIVEHDSRAIRVSPGAVGMPERVVEEDGAAGRRADLQRAGE